MLHEEEAAIDNIARLFEENVICTILTCEEAESSGSATDPAEYHIVHDHGKEACDSDLHEGNLSDIDSDDNDLKGIEREWKRHDESRPLTAEQTITINLGFVRMDVCRHAGIGSRNCRACSANRSL
ncbi:hypothetical protein NL676_032473 [Syzygium grande]|nr:hypothetical protein NL676_032473 [Syzygium grande]